jgi:ParB family chromosome partitioning protein
LPLAPFKMEQIEEIEISKIKTNINQPRKVFEKESIKELSDSIKSVGLINPIQVKKIDGGYELICGERRLKAHELDNRKTIKAIVKEYNSKDDEMVESLVENLHRTDLNSIERENFINKLWLSGKYKTRAELGRVIGMSDSNVRNILLTKNLRETIPFATSDISTRDMQDVLSVKNMDDKQNILKKIQKDEIKNKDLREASKIINKSPSDVKKAFFSNKITMQQADKISKIKDEKTRGKMIEAHRNIKNIDKSIEKNFKNVKPITKRDEVRIKEMIDDFRANAIENQKTIQRTIQSLIKIIPMVNLMDTDQLGRLSRFQNLLETNLSNALELSENLKEKLK